MCFPVTIRPIKIFPTLLYPLSIDDIFEMNNVGIIPEDILPKINAQKKVIVESPRPVNTYDLVEQGGRVVAIANTKGNYTILEHPVTGEDYRAGTDPIPMVVWKSGSWLIISKNHILSA